MLELPGFPMKSPLSAVLSVLRPGRANEREAVDKLRNELRELARSVRQIEERGPKDSARLDQTLSSLSTQLQTATRELTTVRCTLAEMVLRESQLRAVIVRDAELEDEVPTLAALLTRPGTAEHVAAAFEASTLKLEPFPHVVVDGLLPDAVYDALITGLPPVELFGDKPVNKQQIKVPFDVAPTYARRIWRFMAEVLAPQFIAPVVVDKFRDPLTEWIRENWPSLGEDPLRGKIKLHSTDGRIMLRRRGYRIPPHRDPKWGFLTCLLYLARPGDNEAWGTQLYSVASDREAKGAAPHWIDPASCTLEGDVTFTRNRALVFLNSGGAHGASIPADAEPADLERYLYQFRIGPMGSSIVSMMSALPEERKPFWAGKSGDY
jgi:hypothetical protein